MSVVVIKAIHVRNYQSLRTVDITLGRVTVIIGHSDAGKSAFLRATRALIFNQEGQEFIHRKQGKNGVEIHEPAAVAFDLENGHQVVWRRWVTTHDYVLVKPDGTQQTYQKTGGNVPIDIAGILGIFPILTEENKKEQIHFSFQHSAPFLVGDRGGVGANRILGRLTGLHIFANAAKQANAEKDRLRLQLENEKKHSQSLKEQLQIHPDVTQQLAETKALREKLVQWSTTSSKLEKLKALAEQLKNLTVDYRRAQREIKESETIGMQTIADQVQPFLEKYQKVTELRSMFLGAAQDYRKAKGVLPSLPSAENLETACQSLKRWTELNTSLKGWQSTCSETRTMVNQIADAVQEAERDLLKFNSEQPFCPFSRQMLEQVQEKEKYLCPIFRGEVPS